MLILLLYFCVYRYWRIMLLLLAHGPLPTSKSHGVYDEKDCKMRKERTKTGGLQRLSKLPEIEI